MVREAEENADADKQAKEKIEAKNQLEAYLYSIRTTATDTLASKLSDADKTTLTTTATEGLAWLEEHPSEEKEVYDEKRKEAEQVASPIITKAYSATAPSSTDASTGTSSADDSSNDGDGPPPTVEEVE